jgi:hypothetical protein
MDHTNCLQVAIKTLQFKTQHPSSFAAEVAAISAGNRQRNLGATVPGTFSTPPKKKISHSEFRVIFYKMQQVNLWRN